MQLLDTFFSVNYRIVSDFFKNKDYPIFSTILAVTFYEFFTLLFIFDFILFQILDKRFLILNRSNSVGFIIITLILILNYFYYIRNGRYKILLSNFDRMNIKNRKLSFIISIMIMIFIIVLNVLSVYSIKNNLNWL